MSEEQDGRHGKPEPARALVPLEREASARAGAVRPRAAFVTQVLACEARLPDFRPHRRARPSEATSVYGKASTPPQPARVERKL
jgi:hypothetical protein